MHSPATVCPRAHLVSFQDQRPPVTGTLRTSSAVAQPPRGPYAGVDGVVGAPVEAVPVDGSLVDLAGVPSRPAGDELLEDVPETVPVLGVHPTVDDGVVGRTAHGQPVAHEPDVHDVGELLKTKEVSYRKKLISEMKK